MRLIKLTSLRNNNQPVFVSIEHIGHMYRIVKQDESLKRGYSYTVLGVTTHNNGGFDVLETPEEIIELIKKAEVIK